MGIPLSLVTHTEKNNIPHMTSYFHYTINSDTTHNTIKFTCTCIKIGRK